MKNVNTIFASIHESLCRRNTAIAEALKEYRRKVDTANNTLKSDIAKEQIADLTIKTRQLITYADQKAADEAEEKIQELRKLLRAYVIAPPPNMALIEWMRAAKDFKRKLSRVELEGFAEAAEGNYAALSCVERLADENGYRLSFPVVDEYENDLAEIERLFSVPSLWAPGGFVHEGVTCSPDVTYRGVNYGRPDAYRVAIAQSRANGAADKLKEMSARWGDSMHYELTENEDAVADANAKPKTPTVDPIPEDTSEVVRARAAEQAATTKAAAETLERFKI